jgi:hypothetical protein
MMSPFLKQVHTQVKGGTRMSENQNCGIRDFSKYDEMTTEELEEILRLDAEMIDGQESDTEILLYVMEVLTQRKKQAGQTGNTAQEAYETFTQHYLPEIMNTDNTDPVPAKRNKPANRTHRWIRAMAATAAVLVILIAGSVTAKAFGVDVWKAVIQWTQETFHFGEWGTSDTDNNLPYASLQEALEKGNTPAWMVPTWIPEGFNLVDITVEQTPNKKRYAAIYKNREQTLRITVQDYLDEIPVYVEQSDGLVEEYEVSGITYYLFENNKQVHAVWIVDSYECCIAGKVTIDELKLMINSIEKG